MDLLPRSVEEFRDVQYWDAFFKKRGKDGTFEWYGEYSDLCGVLHKYCKAPHRTLVVGCGNSRLSEDLYDVGYRSLINIDISDVAVRQMSDRNAQRRPGMQFVRMDMRELTFEDEHFDCVLDKATLDAIMAEETESISNDVTAIFDEVTRVLKAGGRYICVSLAQGHILDKLLHYFPDNWMVRVHKVEKGQVEKGRGGGRGGNAVALPVFVFVFTKKLRVGPAMPQVLELCLRRENDRPVRVESVQKFKEGVKETQNFALLWQRLRSVHPGEESQFDLWADGNSKVDAKVAKTEPRFTLFIVDNPNVRRLKGTFAVFIVPHGRETEWMFCTSKGRLVLTDNVGFRRLAIATLHRGHKYGSLQDIREELSGHVTELAPDGVGGKGKIPVMSTADDAGERDVCCTGHSEFSGDFVVEDFMTPTQHWHRRLIFLSNRNVVQSEARLYRDMPPPLPSLADRALPPVPCQPPPEEKAPPSKNQKKKAKKAKAKANKAAAAAAENAVTTAGAETTVEAAGNTESSEATANSSDASTVSSSAAATSGSSTPPATSSSTAAPGNSSHGDSGSSTAHPSSSASDPTSAAAAAGGATAATAQNGGVEDEDIDASFLACDHHKAMVCGLSVIRGLAQAPAGSQKALLVGLGGGGLPLFIHRFIPPVSMDVVELDPSVYEISKKWFGLREDDRMAVHVADGLKHITDLAKQDPKPQYSAIMFDVDGKDTSVGMSCPPMSFVEVEFLQSVKSLLAPHGVFILNLVCRDLTLQATVLSRVHEVFATAHCLDIASEVNKIVIALVQPVPCMHNDADLHVPAMEWVKGSAVELEKTIVDSAPPAARSNVRFISSMFAKLQLLS